MARKDVFFHGSSHISYEMSGLDFHEEVAARPENFQARGNIPLGGGNYRPFGAGDFEECMDGNLHPFE